jgi:hypothetical protein
MARVGIVALGALATALALAACGSDSAGDRGAEPTTGPRVSEFVGTVRDSRFLIAIGTGEGRVLAYACDGRGGPGYLLRGRPSGSAISLVSADRHARLDATIRRDHIAGTLSLGGKRHAFRARPARRFGGLYEVTSDTELAAAGRSLAGARLALSLSSRELGAQVVFIPPTTRDVPVTVHTR